MEFDPHEEWWLTAAVVMLAFSAIGPFLPERAGAWWIGVSFALSMACLLGAAGAFKRETWRPPQWRRKK